MNEEKKNENGEIITPPAPASGQEQNSDDGIDYKAEFEKKEKELGQAQHVIVDLKKKKEGSASVDVEAIKEEARKEAAEAAKREIETFKVDLSQDTISDEIGKLTTNPDKQKLIKLHYEKSVVRTGYTRDAIQGDLRKALAIVELPLQEKRMKELQQSVISKSTMGGGSAAGQEGGAQTVKLSDADEAFIKATAKARGVSEDVVRAKLLANKSKIV